MNNKQYDTESEDNLIYTFISVGETEITKVIKYENINLNFINEDGKSFEIYNLGFGDINLETSEVDDKVVSNNNDASIVFNTVLNSIPKFIASRESVGVSVRGSDDKRHKIYHGYLTRNFERFKEDYSFYGIKEGRAESFQKNFIYDDIVILPKY